MQPNQSVSRITVVTTSGSPNPSRVINSASVQPKPFTRANLQHRRKSTPYPQERSQLLYSYSWTSSPSSFRYLCPHGTTRVYYSIICIDNQSPCQGRGVCGGVAIRCAGLDRQRCDGGKAIRPLCMKSRKGTPNTRQANRCQSLSVTATLPGLNVAASSRRPLTILDHQSSDGQLSLIAVIAPLQCQTT